MDCEYVIVFTAGLREEKSFRPFHAPTLEEAKEKARMWVRSAQAEWVRDSPFAPVVVKGQLCREIEEIDGAQFIKPITPPSPPKKEEEWR